LTHCDPYGFCTLLQHSEGGYSTAALQFHHLAGLLVLKNAETMLQAPVTQSLREDTTGRAHFLFSLLFVEHAALPNWTPKPSSQVDVPQPGPLRAPLDLRTDLASETHALPIPCTATPSADGSPLSLAKAGCEGSLCNALLPKAWSKVKTSCSKGHEATATQARVRCSPSPRP
jgi:hypothetical protein